MAKYSMRGIFCHICGGWIRNKPVFMYKKERNMRRKPWWIKAMNPIWSDSVCQIKSRFLHFIRVYFPKVSDLRIEIPPDNACCGSFLLDTQGPFLYSYFSKTHFLSMKKYQRITECTKLFLKINKRFIRNPFRSYL